jgi:hypothetical protein
MKNLLPSILAASSLLVMLGVRPAAATVLVSVSGSAPASSFASNTTSSGAGLQWRNDTTNGLRDVGQSFSVATNLSLNAITFQIASNSAPGTGVLNAAFNLSIFQVSPNNNTGIPSGAAISVQSGILTGLTATSLDWSKYVTFTLGTSVALTSGNTYAVMLDFTTQAANRNIVFQYNSPSSYVPGQMIISTNGTSYSLFDSSNRPDFVFYATAVPEPSTVVLGLLGVAFLVLRRRSRHA